MALSLLFGAAQVAAGIGVTVRLLPRKPWRSTGPFLLLVIGLWFVCSGLAELAVSGMELAKVTGGRPRAGAFALWRGRADALLFAATAALALALLVRAVFVGLFLRESVASGKR